MAISPEKEAAFKALYGITEDAPEVAQPEEISITPDKEAAFREIYGIEEPKPDMGKLAASVQGFNETLPFGNRIAAGIGALAASPFIEDKTTSQLYDEARAAQAGTAEANPNQVLIGNLAGLGATLPIGFSKGVATTPVLGKVANAVTNAAQATGNFIRGGELSANAGRLAKLGKLGAQAAKSAGVALGGAYVYKAGNGAEGDRTLSMDEASLATGIGAAVPVAGAVAGKVLSKGADIVASRAAKRSGELQPITNTNKKALEKVYARLSEDTGGDLKSNLASYLSTKDKALVNIGGARTANLAEGAAQFPSGEAVSKKYFDEVIGRAPEKLKASINKTISPSQNYYDDAEKIVKEGRKAAEPLYTQAYKLNKQVSSPRINRLLDTPQGVKALNEAVNDMRSEMALASAPDKELTELAREAGLRATGAGVGKGLKLQTLDYTKRALDRMEGTAIRQGDLSEARRIGMTRRALIEELDTLDKSGFYSKARQQSGDYLSASKALENGTNFLRDDKQLIQRNFAEMSASEKKAYKVGVLKVMRENIENRQDGANVATLFNKSANRDKLAAILSPKEYTKLMDDAYATDGIYKLRNQILGNSRTATRQIAAEEFGDDTLRAMGDVATKGVTRTALDNVARAISRRFKGLSDKTAGEVARILYETDPKEKYKIIKDLVALSKQNNLRSTEAAQKLQLFYGLSDAVKQIRNNPVVTSVVNQTID